VNRQSLETPTTTSIGFEYSRGEAKRASRDTHTDEQMECPQNDLTCAPWAKCFVNGPLPCSNSLSGNIFLFVIYSFLIMCGTYERASAVVALAHKSSSTFVSFRSSRSEAGER